ncbi:hypothetical protein ACLOJK_013002 [Asimina triloba]
MPENLTKGFEGSHSKGVVVLGATHLRKGCSGGDCTSEDEKKKEREWPKSPRHIFAAFKSGGASKWWWYGGSDTPCVGFIGICIFNGSEEHEDGMLVLIVNMGRNDVSAKCHYLCGKFKAMCLDSPAAPIKLASSR